MQPLKLRTRHMPTKITKPPKKGKGAKYDRQQQKKDWKKNESAVVESPDGIHDKNYGQLHYAESDARPFGYFKGKFYMSKNPETHWQMGDREIKEIPGSWRKKFKYPGRIWLDKKVFSLWEYPKTVGDWKKLISDLSSKTGKNIRKDFKVEMAKAFGKSDDLRGKERIIPVSDLMDKLEGKSGRKVKIPQHSKDTQNLQHLKSPMIKGKQNIPAGLGSKKKVAGLTATQYHQKFRTSDGVIRLSPLVETILKIRRVHILLEQLLKEGSGDAWSTYFVIGPNGKFIHVGYGTKYAYHGETVREYPVIYKELLKKLGANKPPGYAEAKVAEMARNGEDDLYKYMYSKGFVRGGRFWVAFDPKKASSKSLMKVLELAKNGNVKKFDVEFGVGDKFHYDVTIDEFIEKFL